MKMKNNLLYILLLSLLGANGCEVFTIKGKKIEIEKSIEQTQTTPVGVATILINELNDNNVFAAAELMAKEDGTLYSASEKYSKSSELSRLKRFIANSEITQCIVDTLETDYRVTFEFNYSKQAVFDTKLINNLYYVTKFSQKTK